MFALGSAANLVIYKKHTFIAWGKWLELNLHVSKMLSDLGISKMPAQGTARFWTQASCWNSWAPVSAALYLYSSLQLNIWMASDR